MLQTHYEKESVLIVKVETISIPSHKTEKKYRPKGSRCFKIISHRCPSCGKELPSNKYLKINYLCSKCKNKAESTPEFGEKCQ